jgi:hypothetical protein
MEILEWLFGKDYCAKRHKTLKQEIEEADRKRRKARFDLEFPPEERGITWDYIDEDGEHAFHFPVK